MWFREVKCKRWRGYTRKHLDIALSDWEDISLGELEFQKSLAKDYEFVPEFSTQCDGNPAAEYKSVNADRSSMRKTKVNKDKLGTI